MDNQDRMRILVLANQKGGVGKTTTALNLGAALARRGNQVLLIDLDQQGSLTISCGLDPEQLELTTYTIVSSHATAPQEKQVPLSKAILRVEKVGLDLIPANIDLSVIDLALQNAPGRDFILKNALMPVQKKYDYILLDCPPSLGLLVINALAAADEIIIPLQTQYLASRGVKLLLDTIGLVRQRINSKLQITGILLTMVDTRTIHQRQIVEMTRNSFAGAIPVFETMIRVNVRLQEAPISGLSILDYDPNGSAALAYNELAQEVDNVQITV
jgi:chromosome partitioning protein